MAGPKGRHPVWKKSSGGPDLIEPMLVSRGGLKMPLQEHIVIDNHASLFSAIQKDTSKSPYFAFVNLEMVKEVDRHVVHAWQNFPTKPGLY